MIFEISNPSDPYTIEGELLPCAIATMFIGRGMYALRGGSEQVMPVFLFGGHEEWLKDHGVESFETYVESHLPEVAAALESVLIGTPIERTRMMKKFEAIADAGERAVARAAWHKERRSSMNDIGAVAAGYAALVRERIT